jgi:hypothetical protein
MRRLRRRGTEALQFAHAAQQIVRIGEVNDSVERPTAGEPLTLEKVLCPRKEAAPALYENSNKSEAEKIDLCKLRFYLLQADSGSE